MNYFFLRLGALLLHALLNMVVLTYATQFDITGSWLLVTFFVLLVFVLLALFIMHLISFIHYIKNRTK